MKTYFQTDELQQLIDFEKIMLMPRYSGGHDHQMKGLFKDVIVIAHWNEGDYQGSVATCVKFNDGKYKDYFVIYNDYYGSCSGCDAWEDASDEEVKNMCIGLSNSSYVFKTIKDVKDFLQNPDDEGKLWSSWSNPGLHLLTCIGNNVID